jgi:hypothetical protein
MLVVIAASREARALATREAESIDLTAPEAVGVLIARVRKAGTVAGEGAGLVVAAATGSIRPDVLQVRLRSFDEIGDAEGVLPAIVTRRMYASRSVAAFQRTLYPPVRNGLGSMVVCVARSSVQRGAANAGRCGAGKSSAASRAIANAIAVTLLCGERI